MGVENYYKKLVAPLMGGKIESLVVDEDFVGIIVRGKDKVKRVVWFLSDEEGNAPGSIQIRDL